MSKKKTSTKTSKQQAQKLVITLTRKGDKVTANFVFEPAYQPKLPENSITRAASVLLKALTDAGADK